jgi:hypothetical protein
MSIRKVFFPGEFQQFQTFCNDTNVLAAPCAYVFHEELMNPGTHPANRINIGFTDENYTFRRTSSPCVSKKGGRKSPKKGGRKSPKKGGRKSPKKGGRNSPKKGKKSVEAKRKANYRRVISRRRRKTIAAAAPARRMAVVVKSGASLSINDYYKLVGRKVKPVNLTTHYVEGSGTPPDLKHVYLLLYNPELVRLFPNAVEGTANRLDRDQVCWDLRYSNNDLSNCGDERQKKPEYCGNCVISNNMVSLNLDNKLIGSVVNGRSTCNYEEHSNILWHTHPLTSRPWPSGEDIAKMIKRRPGEENDKIPVVSLIFTKWGIWQIVVPMHAKGDIGSDTVENITNIGLKIFEEKWQRKTLPPAPPTCLNNFEDPIWKESIRNRVNKYILTLAHYVPQLDPYESTGGFIIFNFWDKIAERDFAYKCYIPEGNNSIMNPEQDN